VSVGCAQFGEGVLNRRRAITTDLKIFSTAATAVLTLNFDLDFSKLTVKFNTDAEHRTWDFARSQNQRYVMTYSTFGDRAFELPAPDYGTVFRRTSKTLTYRTVNSAGR